jgi:polyisoprenoid-binding protein YceI
MLNLRRFMQRIIALLVMFFVSLMSNTFANAATETYTIDPAHTYVLWHINHFGFSNPSGKWMVAEGTINLDQAKPQDSKVDITIHVADIITGIPELDKHLKSAAFFDVEKFPTATFVSDKIQMTGKNTANVQGTLTLHGVSKPISLRVTMNKIGENPITNKPTVGFSASTKLKRSDFGISTLIPELGDEITINIEAEAYK